MGKLPKSSVGEFDMTGDYSIPQAATRIVQLFIYQNGTIVDFSSGYTAKLQVRQSYNAPVILELNTSDSSIVLSNGAASTPNVVLTFTPAKTTNPNVFTDLIYDLAIYKSDGSVFKFMQGQLEITPRVTQ